MTTPRKQPTHRLVGYDARGQRTGATRYTYGDRDNALNLASLLTDYHEEGDYVEVYALTYVGRVTP